MTRRFWPVSTPAERVSLAALALVVAACPAHTPVAGRPGTPTVLAPKVPVHPASVRDICLAFERAEKNVTRLGEFHDRCIAGMPPPLDDRSPEMEKARRECEPGQASYDGLDKAVKSGRIALDGDRLQICLTRARARQRSLADAVHLKPHFSDPDCAAVLVPLRREGEACEEDIDCPDGLRCEPPDPTVQKLTCLRPAAIGARCSVRTCEAGALCFEDKCVPRRALGEACAFLQDNENACVAGMVCDAGSGRCEKLMGVGEACGNCEDGLKCVAGHCVGLFSVPDGSPCSDSAQCAGSCSACQLTATGAVCAPRGAAQAACSYDADCQHGFVCVLPPGQDRSSDETPPFGACALLQAEGGRCASDVVCAKGLFCDPQAGCSRRTEGKPCSSSASCEEGLFCVNDFCQKDRPPEGRREPPVLLASAGTPCTVGDQCESRLCLTPEHVCAAKRPDACGTSRDQFGQWLPLAAFLLWPRRRWRQSFSSSRPQSRSTAGR